MTEHEWLTCTDPHDMLRCFPAQWDSRKLWLFGCACLRRVWHLLKDRHSRHCVEMAERFVDGKASQEQAAAAWVAFDAAVYDGGLEDFPGFDSQEAVRNLACFVDPAASLQLACEVADGVGAFAAESIPVGPLEEWSTARTDAWKEAARQERAVQAHLLRDVFGNPFRPVSADPTWLTVNVLELAQVIYGDRAFDRLPMLADALEKAGCDNADVLTHCRRPGEHVRGCWVVDALLGRG